jgi:hypothetical protein
MTFMTYNRNKNGEKFPLKQTNYKNGTIVGKTGKEPHNFYKKDAGYEKNLLVNQTFDK